MDETVIKLDLECRKALEAQRQSHAESLEDILRRVLTGRDASGRATELKAGPVPVDWLDPYAATERKTGAYRVEMGEMCHFAPSQKAAYRLALIWLEKARPGALARLAGEGSARRRIVAGTPQALFPHSTALVKHAEKLADGWYVDVNLSRDQKVLRLKTACRLAGLEFGKDLIVDL